MDNKLERVNDSIINTDKEGFVKARARKRNLILLEERLGSIEKDINILKENIKIIMDKL